MGWGCVGSVCCVLCCVGVAWPRVAPGSGRLPLAVAWVVGVCGVSYCVGVLVSMVGGVPAHGWYARWAMLMLNSSSSIISSGLVGAVMYAPAPWPDCE